MFLDSLFTSKHNPDPGGGGLLNDHGYNEVANQKSKHCANQSRSI